jgi:hypothetical protein
MLTDAWADGSQFYCPDSNKKLYKIRLDNEEIVDSIVFFDRTFCHHLYFDGDKLFFMAGDTYVCSVGIGNNFSSNKVDSFNLMDIRSHLDSLYDASNARTARFGYRNFLTFCNNKIKVIGMNYYHIQPSDDNTYHTDILPYQRYLYIEEKGIWDTINIQNGFELLTKPSAYVICYWNRHFVITSSAYAPTVDVNDIYKWNDEEIAISINVKQDSVGDKTDLRTLLLYNVITKQWRKFIFPPEILSNAATDLLSVMYWHNSYYFIVGKYNNFAHSAIRIYKYTGSNAGIEDAEAGVFPDIWINKIYPNPVTTRSKVNADIMCFVTDLSKINVGLYNSLGVKLMDLSDQFEYDASSSKIFVSFYAPDIPKGVYYLNVKYGKEVRTKVLIID